jgi:hypothetical protein
MSSQYNVYINITDKEINKGCSIEFLSARTILAFVYKENVRCTRLMQRSLQVVIRQKFVLWMLYSRAHPPIVMAKNFQSLVYILHFIWGSRNDRLNEFVRLIYIYNNVMRSCNERTTLHSVQPYLYYIILVNKQISLEE